MSMTVIRTADSEWLVVDDGRTVAGPFETSAEAWRWIDRYEGEPISRAEQSSTWFMKQMGV